MVVALSMESLWYWGLESQWSSKGINDACHGQLIWIRSMDPFVTYKHQVNEVAMDLSTPTFDNSFQSTQPTFSWLQAHLKIIKAFITSPRTVSPSPLCRSGKQDPLFPYYSNLTKDPSNLKYLSIYGAMETRRTWLHPATLSLRGTIVNACSTTLDIIVTTYIVQHHQHCRSITNMILRTIAPLSSITPLPFIIVTVGMPLPSSTSAALISPWVACRHYTTRA